MPCAHAGYGFLSQTWFLEHKYVLYRYMERLSCTVLIGSAPPAEVDVLVEGATAKTTASVRPKPETLNPKP